MEAAGMFVLLVLAVFYAAFMGALAHGFRKVVRVPSDLDPSDAHPFVSVIIAARDEASTIRHCVTSVLGNDYPPDRFEVIVVDDHSQDETAGQVQDLQRHYVTRNLRLLQPEESASGGHKQAALACGVADAQGPWILVTDADCTVGPGWIRSMARFFSKEVAFVAGPVQYQPRPTFFSRLQALEFIGLVAVGAGSIGLGRPTICNGANVAYRRSAYEAFHATPDAASDPAADELLAQHLARDHAGSVRFCADPLALVTTPPASSVRAFWDQRRRWAATGARFSGGRLRALVMAVYAFYLWLLLSVFFLPLGGATGGAVILALFLKVSSEHLLLRNACIHFGTRKLLRHHFPGQVLQVPYIVFVSALGALRPTPWKGRTVHL